ncbi:MAG: GTPase HflX [Pseudomonadota bacterium]
MFDRPKSGERAVLVLGGGNDELPVLEELQELARSAGADPVGYLISKREHADPKFFIGKGKVEELGLLIESLGAELVLFNNPLSPSQERNLEKALQVRVLDRTGLILDIFAQRAQSYEGKLQVELAQLKHLSTRLVRGWTHLERQKGGIGLRGPGETQLETDKRLIGRRILQIQKRLEKVDRQRDQGRRARRRTEVPVVGLVGYTNAGKSTLINALTGAGVYAADQLFATLDPTLKRYTIGQGQTVVLADTVGFVRDLPHELVAAFKSTLQETVEADLLLHVIDATDEQLQETIDEVERVIDEIGAGDVPRVRVLNKIDGLEGREPTLERNADGRIDAVWLSAKDSRGLELIDEIVREQVVPQRVRREIRIKPSEGRLRAQLYEQATVLSETVDEEGGWVMQVEGNPDRFRKLHLADDAEHDSQLHNALLA